MRQIPSGLQGRLLEKNLNTGFDDCMICVIFPEVSIHSFIVIDLHMKFLDRFLIKNSFAEFDNLLGLEQASLRVSCKISFYIFHGNTIYNCQQSCSLISLTKLEMVNCCYILVICLGYHCTKPQIVLISGQDL